MYWVENNSSSRRFRLNPVFNQDAHKFSACYFKVTDLWLVEKGEFEVVTQIEDVPEYPSYWMPLNDD